MGFREIERRTSHSYSYTDRVEIFMRFHTDNESANWEIRRNNPWTFANVAEIAMNLGGGGHPLAAGCKLDGPLAKAESLVVELSKEAIAQQQMYANGR